MTLPALIARKGHEQPFVFANDPDSISSQELAEMIADLGEGWDVWVEMPMIEPIGCNLPHRGKGRPCVLATVISLPSLD